MQANIFKCLIVFSLLLTACTSEQKKAEQTRLQHIMQQQVLTIGTLNGPTTVYEDNGQTRGFEYDLITAFANELHVQTRFVYKKNLRDLLQAVEAGEIDIAAASLAHTKERQHLVAFSIPYHQVTQELVCRRHKHKLKDISELDDSIRLTVAARSSYAERLAQLKQQYPQLSWKEENIETSVLLHKVDQKTIDCTIADSNIVAIERRYTPSLNIRLQMSDPQDIAWAMPLKAKTLQQRVDQWLSMPATKTLLKKLNHRYYEYSPKFDYVDLQRFQRRIKTRLPKYQAWFQQAAEKHQLPWTVFAAQAYQESHWNPKARSFTGVRGMMMLTRSTAKELHIQNRLDAQQSIEGGARYLSKLIQRLPKSIKEEDRLWFALAAYNMGMAHLYDARKLARLLGSNPDSWQEMAMVLPFLSQRKYFGQLKHGYARGREPVLYVQRIRDYEDILKRQLGLIHHGS